MVRNRNVYRELVSWGAQHALIAIICISSPAPCLCLSSSNIRYCSKLQTMRLRPRYDLPCSHELALASEMSALISFRRLRLRMNECAPSKIKIKGLVQTQPMPLCHFFFCKSRHHCERSSTTNMAVWFTSSARVSCHFLRNTSATGDRLVRTTCGRDIFSVIKIKKNGPAKTMFAEVNYCADSLFSWPHSARSSKILFRIELSDVNEGRPV